jgi:hypothetical protein
MKASPKLDSGKLKNFVLACHFQTRIEKGARFRAGGEKIRLEWASVSFPKTGQFKSVVILDCQL